MADDCVLAGLLILARPAPKGCTGPRSVIDFFDVRTKGTHAVYVESPQRVRIETVADVRGVRPWAPRSRWSGSSWSGAGRRYEPRHATALRATPVSAQRTRQAGEPYAGLRRHDVTSAEGVSRFAAPLDLLDAPRSPRPEIEDELADDPD